MDWDKTEREAVTALIEVKVEPQLGDGFDRVAERIYQYEEVESCYLMSGDFDMTVIISGRTLRRWPTLLPEAVHHRRGAVHRHPLHPEEV